MSDDELYKTVSCAKQPLTDIGNGRRFAIRCSDTFRYDPKVGWFQFDDARWRPCAFDHALAAAKAVVEQIAKESEITEDGDSAKRKAWAERSCGYHAMERLLKCARSEPELMIDASTLGARPILLNVANGTLVPDKDGEPRLKIHEARDHLTRLAPVHYDPSAKCPLWEQHLQRVLPEVEVRNYLQRVFGSCLAGGNADHAFFLFLGAGRDGKSTTVNVIARVLGDYATNMDARLLVESRMQTATDSASPQIASLSGDTRLVSLSEPPREAYLNEGLIKQLVGNSPIVARALHKEPIHFVPRFKMVLECNALPRISGGDDGIWRRLRVVPWRTQIPDHAVDLGIEQKLMTESAGILNWLLRGLEAYRRRGLDEPHAVVAETAKYRGAPQVVVDWFEDCVKRDPTAVSEVVPLRENFEAWCKTKGRRPVLGGRFTQALIALGAMQPKDDSRSRRIRVSGLRLSFEAASQIG